jgi:hypothetical protein
MFGRQRSNDTPKLAVMRPGNGSTMLPSSLARTHSAIPLALNSRVLGMNARSYGRKQSRTFGYRAMRPTFVLHKKAAYDATVEFLPVCWAWEDCHRWTLNGGSSQTDA